MLNMNYHENRQRGTADFPVEFHHIESTHPHYTMSYHWHVEFELIRILEGTFHISIDGREFTAVKGSSILIPAGCLHSGIPQDCMYECIVYDMNMLLKENDVSRKYIKQIINHQLNLDTYFDPSYSNIHRIIWILFDALASRKPGYQLLVQGSLYQLFGTILSEGYYHTDPVQTPLDHRRMKQLKQVLEYIEEGYASPINLEDLSRITGMSRKYFCRFFREMTHRTPIDYLNYYRIERACVRLIITDLPITEIAFSCGFNDLSYFIKTFRKYKQMAPKQYRKWAC